VLHTSYYFGVPADGFHRQRVIRDAEEYAVGRTINTVVRVTETLASQDRARSLVPARPPLDTSVMEISRDQKGDVDASYN
jgi:alkyl hydroperoxide reductase subunit AhpC